GLELLVDEIERRDVVDELELGAGVRLELAARRLRRGQCRQLVALDEVRVVDRADASRGSQLVRDRRKHARPADLAGSRRYPHHGRRWAVGVPTIARREAEPVRHGWRHRTNATAADQNQNAEFAGFSSAATGLFQNLWRTSVVAIPASQDQKGKAKDLQGVS